jgi:RimJ/RimL family protein N-acetyltransferase
MKPVVDPASGLPIGPEIDPAPARRPMKGTVLEGRHVVLAPVDPAAQADTLYAETHGPEADALWLYLSTGPFADPALFRAYLDRAAVSEDPLFFAILDRTTGRPLGHATYMRIEPAHRVIEVGNILYTPKLQRSPGATEAMYLMARHAFEELGYRRYEWKCNALNAPSRRAALRLGFTYEGTFRDHMIVKRRSRHTAWFSMLADEWPARKAAFERWLDPTNFDQDGRQRLSLSALNAWPAVDGDGIARAGVPGTASS